MKKGQNPSFPLSVKGKGLIHAWYNVTYLPTRSFIHEPPPIILVTREDNIILDVVGFTSQLWRETIYINFFVTWNQI